MANPLYEQIGQNGFLTELNRLKSMGGDPNRMIQNLLSTGRVSQAQVNYATQRARQLMQMFPSSGRR